MSPEEFYADLMLISLDCPIYKFTKRCLTSAIIFMIFFIMTHVFVVSELIPIPILIAENMKNIQNNTM